MTKLLDTAASVWKAIWPALPPIAVFALGDAVFVLISQTPAGIAAPADWSKPGLMVADTATAGKGDPLTALQSIAGNEALARATAWGACLALVLVCAGAIVVACAVLAQRLKDQRLWWPINLAGLLMAAAGAIGLWRMNFHTYHYFGDALFGSTVCAQHPPMLAFLGKACAFDAMLVVGSVASVIAAAYVAAAVCALGWRGAQSPVTASQADVDADTKDRLLGGDQLKYLLFSASAVFFFGVFALRAWNSWPAAFYVLPNEKLAKATFDVALQGYVNIQALTYVFVLLAMFGPVAFLLRVSPSAPGAVSAAPTTASLWSEAIQKALAVLAPLLASPALAMITAMSHAASGTPS